MENQKFTELIEKRRMRAFPPPRRSDAKSSHSPVCDSFFLGLSGQIFADLRSRPTKILNISAFRDFFTETFSGNPEELRKISRPRLRPLDGVKLTYVVDTVFSYLFNQVMYLKSAKSFFFSS